MEDELEFDLRILSLDLSLAFTGYAIYRVSTGKLEKVRSRNGKDFLTRNFAFQIPDFGIIETDAKLDIASRIRYLLHKTIKIITDYEINYIICEEPPNVVFGNKKLPAVAAASKAANVMKLLAAYYSFYGYFYNLDIYFRGIKPREWQGIKEKNEHAKADSIRKAQFVLNYLGVKKKLLKGEHHISDAINIGLFAIKQLKSGKWELPILAPLSSAV